MFSKEDEELRRDLSRGLFDYVIVQNGLLAILHHISFLGMGVSKATGILRLFYAKPMQICYIIDKIGLHCGGSNSYGTYFNY